MKSTVFFFLLFSCSSLYGQDHFSIQDNRNAASDTVPAFFKELALSNELIVSFRTVFRDIDEESNYFILTKEKNKFRAFKYLRKSDKVQPILLDPAQLVFIWDTFVQNDLFNIQDEKDIPNFCAEKYEIYNSYSYEFVLYNNGKIKKLSYYNPEHYDNVCFGMPERGKIINSVAVIAHVLRL